MSNFRIRWDSRAGPVFIASIRNKKFAIALFCHRKEERCIRILGHKSVLCARCTGIFVGILITYFLFAIKVVVPFMFSSILMIPLLIDGVSQFLNFRQSNNTLRFTTGVLFSLGLFNLMVW